MAKKDYLDKNLTRLARLVEAEFGLSRGDLFLSTRPEKLDNGDWRCARETFAFIFGYVCDECSDNYKSRTRSYWQGRMQMPNPRAVSLLLDKKPSYIHSIRNIWNSLSKNDKIIKRNDFEELLKSLKQKHRKREELPDPTKEAWDEVNRRDARFQARISPDTLSRVQAFLDASGASKKDFTEQALNELLDRLEADQ